jgi:hypothetical protein
MSKNVSHSTNLGIFRNSFKIFSYIYRQNPLRLNHQGIGEDSEKEKETNVDIGLVW